MKKEFLNLRKKSNLEMLVVKSPNGKVILDTSKEKK